MQGRMIGVIRRAGHGLSLAVIAAVLLTSASAAAQQALRPEVGKPLQAAQQAISAGRYSEALSQVAEAEKAGQLSDYEAYMIARLRAAAATGAGQWSTALSAYEQALASGALPAAERLPMMEAVARIAYTSKNYAKAVQAIRAYEQAGGSNAQTLGLLPQTLYLAGDYAAAAGALKSQIAALERAGQKPSEQQIQLLASAALKQNDNAGYLQALQKLVQYYPAQNYWLDLIVRTANRPGFSERALALDVYRLRAATGTMQDPQDYMEAAQLALLEGYPGEAQQFIDMGYEAGVLGKEGDIARQMRLKTLVAEKAAEDRRTWAEGEKAAAAQATGEALVATGLNYVGYGEYDKGIALIEQGIAKGGLENPEHAKLHLGIAYAKAGQKQKALETLRSVRGADGASDLARLWIMRTLNA